MRFKKSKNIKYYLIILLVLVFSIYLFPNQIQAATAEGGASTPGSLKLVLDAAESVLLAPLNTTLWIIKNALSLILFKVIAPIVSAVMSYNNFFTEGVNIGWKVTRDFANLFFALALLLIAVATVLNIGPLDNYTAKRMLPNFIMVALFINFSKAIVGFLIDISQIIMVELWNATGGGDGFKNTIMKVSNLNQAGIANVADISNGAEAVAMNLVIIVLIALLIAIFLWTIVILIVRIANLWIVIMLAPLAFMSFLIPGIRELYNTWIKLLQGALVTGPVLMFMLYLSITVMNSGFPTIPADGNLLYDGNMLTYLLVAILLFASNAIATKAVMEAPPLLQKAAGIATGIATLGVGAKVGAGGTGFRQGLKETWSATGGKLVSATGKLVSATDGAISGTTRGVQILSGGKVNPNDRYEMMKQRRKERTEKGQGVENIPVIGSMIKDSRTGKWISSVAQQTLGGEAGRKANFENTLDNLAEEANRNGTLDNNPTLARAYANKIASETKKITEEDSSVPELIEKLKKTVDSATGKAIMMRITQLEGLDELLEDRDFKKYAEIHENRSEQINALIQDKFETNPGESTPRTLSRQDRAFRSRITQVAKNTKQEAFVNNDARSKVEDLSITEMGQVLKTNRSAFEIRSKDATTGAFEFDGNKAKYQLDISIIDNAILKGDVRLLEDPKTWAPYKEPDKEEIRNYIKDQISSRGISSGDIYKRYTKALQGLGN